MGVEEEIVTGRAPFKLIITEQSVGLVAKRGQDAGTKGRLLRPPAGACR